MRAVLDFLTSCVELIKMWLRQRYGDAALLIVRLIALLFVMTPAASGCARWAEPTAVTSPAPLTPGAS